MLNRGQRIRIVKTSSTGHPAVGDEGYICDVIYFLEDQYFLVSVFFFHYPGFASDIRCEKRLVLLNPLNTARSAMAFDIIQPILREKSTIYSPTKLTEGAFAGQVFSRFNFGHIVESGQNLSSYTYHDTISSWRSRQYKESFKKLALPVVVLEPIREKAEIKSSGQLRAWISAYGPLISVSVSAPTGTLLRDTALGINELISDRYLVRRADVERLLLDRTRLREVVARIRLLETQMHSRIIRQTILGITAPREHFELYSRYCRGGLNSIVLGSSLPSTSHENNFMTLYLATIFSRAKEEMSILFLLFGQSFFSAPKFDKGRPTVQRAINNLWGGRDDLTYLMTKLHFIVN